MKRPMTYALIVAAVVGAGASLSHAPVAYGGGLQGGRGHGDRMMHRLDLNGDGGISAVEASVVGAVRFLRFDTDGDGEITEAEMWVRIQRRIDERVTKRFAIMDRNGDGRLERAEFDETGTAHFVRMDTDGDGRVSRDELRARRHRMGHGGHDDTLPVK
jgi:hypothetical protein